MKAALIDLDGTVARKGKRNYYQWHKVGLDSPIEEVVEIVKNYKGKVIILTGRNSGYKKDGKMAYLDNPETVGFDETEKWVKEYIGDVERIIMKPANSRENSAKFKVDRYNELIEEGYDIEFIMDDNDSVAEAFREIGLLVLQVHDREKEEYDPNERKKHFE